eukprot:COSAG03_NODE_9003_length_752_cov_3.704441_2_plen_102_part_01
MTTQHLVLCLSVSLSLLVQAEARAEQARADPRYSQPPRRADSQTAATSAGGRKDTAAAAEHGNSLGITHAVVRFPLLPSLSLSLSLSLCIVSVFYFIAGVCL